MQFADAMFLRMHPQKHGPPALKTGEFSIGTFGEYSSGTDTDGPLGFLVIYAPPGEDYFCAEPVSNCTDAFNLSASGRDDTGLLGT